jgi:uracil-DNA glycosylase family 4
VGVDEDIRQELALLRELGFTHLDLAVDGGRSTVDEAPQREAAQTRETRPVASNQQPIAPPERASSTVHRQPATTADGAPSTNSILSSPSLSELGVLAAPCTRCRLAKTRTQVVFGTGNPNADLVFVGEAPGHDEDVKGEPFVGRAGQLLTDIIKAMKMTRDDVYIANVIKCRPPENRNPEADELEACKPYIRKQLEFLRPRVIVTLGRFALQSLTGKGYSISAVRGQWLESDGIKVMPTYHPAYLLRTPSAKKEVWADMKKVMAELGITF